MENYSIELDCDNEIFTKYLYNTCIFFSFIIHIVGVILNISVIVKVSVLENRYVSSQFPLIIELNYVECLKMEKTFNARTANKTKISSFIIDRKK